MAKEISKSQIDRLGERLQLGKTEDDLRLLEQYRHSFRTAHEFVYKEIREKLSLELTKRRTKTTQSIVDKLLRESIRLTQIQDIAGCRIIARDIADQDKIVQQLCELFNDIKLIDRRTKPSHGYRAIHVIVFIKNKAIEIQVRTAIQHLWAELSEKYADMCGQKIKYGKGEEQYQHLLSEWSSIIKRYEDYEVILNQQLNNSTEPIANSFSINDKNHQMNIDGRLSAIVIELGELVTEINDEKIKWQLAQAITILYGVKLNINIRLQISEVEKLK